MKRLLRDVLEDDGLARSLAERGRRTILARHTCAHRVDELLAIDRQLRLDPAVPPIADIADAAGVEVRVGGPWVQE